METQSQHASNSLDLKALNALSGMDFLIKDYQRGYRWSAIEVERLLDDFAEFVSRDKLKGEFYCLQPIVVRKLDDTRFEVIDGQQRLTTINILLQYLNEGIRFLYPGFRLYDIEYVTRPSSRKFLSNIRNQQANAHSYIDFHFMASAYLTIEEWFRKKADDTLRNKILRALLESERTISNGLLTDTANNIRVIWYEVSADDKTSSVEIFTRLNIGKIPLTDAELVKALFLRNSNFPESEAELRKIHLSTEWNMMEQGLRDERFWHFLNRSSNPMKYSSRIEFIFDLISGRTKRSRKYHTFEEFHSLIASEGAETIWMKVKQTYDLLFEWYSDRELYHIIGYLLEQGVRINELREKWETRTKTDFRDNYLRSKVRDSVGHINISELSYGQNSEIRKVLLLFNILTVLLKDNSDMRFPFDRFKTEKWDIEHVCSQTDRKLEKSGIFQWSRDILGFYSVHTDSVNIVEAINEAGYEESLRVELLAMAELLQSENPDKDKASELFSKFEKRFNESASDIPDKDHISNLALLDYTTNRSYGNAFFPIKRKRIIENDSMGVFVPIATKNLFLKYYSPRVNNVECWTKEDGEHYLKAITDTINNYITPEIDE